MNSEFWVYPVFLLSYSYFRKAAKRKLSWVNDDYLVTRDQSNQCKNIESKNAKWSSDRTSTIATIHLLDDNLDVGTVSLICIWPTLRQSHRRTDTRTEYVQWSQSDVRRRKQPLHRKHHQDSKSKCFATTRTAHKIIRRVKIVISSFALGAGAELVCMYLVAAV